MRRTNQKYLSMTSDQEPWHSQKKDVYKIAVCDASEIGGSEKCKIQGS